MTKYQRNEIADAVRRLGEVEENGLAVYHPRDEMLSKHDGCDIIGVYVTERGDVQAFLSRPPMDEEQHFVDVDLLSMYNQERLYNELVRGEVGR